METTNSNTANRLVYVYMS